jgi:hypothetical protein
VNPDIPGVMYGYRSVAACHARFVGDRFQYVLFNFAHDVSGFVVSQ